MENFIGYFQLYFKIHFPESNENHYMKWSSDFTKPLTEERLLLFQTTLEEQSKQAFNKECEVSFITEEEYEQNIKDMKTTRYKWNENTKDLEEIDR